MPPSHLGEVHWHVQVVVEEGRVLLGIQQLEKSRGRVARVATTKLRERGRRGKGRRDRGRRKRGRRERGRRDDRKKREAGDGNE